MKPLFTISCPIDTYSGYGARSRDLVKSIIDLDKYEVVILPQMWGNTPWGFINDHEEWKFLTPYISENNQLPRKPDVWMQITVPNEFQPLGKYNIGVTAGIETTVCHPSWIEGLNRMDLNIVPSNHSKKVFVNSKFEKRNEKTNSLVEVVELKKPIEVVFEGINLDLYKYIPNSEISINLDQITEKFAYLFVGTWMQGEIGEDRKNVGFLIKSFYEVFKNKKNAPALILKTSSVGASYMDREFILDKINAIKDSIKAKTLPNVYLLHGEFSDKEINELYNHPKVKALVSLTKGEGFGRPLLEFTQSKKPIITTNWSGHIDFLNPKFTTLLDGELTQVHQSAIVKDIILPEGSWFSPSIPQVGSALTQVFSNYKHHQENAMKQASYAKNRFSLEHMKNLVEDILTQNIPEFPEEVQLQLPQLETLELPELEQL